MQSYKEQPFGCGNMITAMIVGDPDHQGKIVQLDTTVINECQDDSVKTLIRTVPALFNKDGLEIVWDRSYFKVFEPVEL